MSLRNQVIRLAFRKPQLRSHLLPLLKEAAGEPYTRPNSTFVDANDVRGETITQALAKHLVHATKPKKTGIAFYALPEAFNEKLTKLFLKEVKKDLNSGLRSWLRYEVEHLDSVIPLRGVDYDELGPGPEGDEQYGYRDQSPEFPKLLEAVKKVRVETKEVTSPTSKRRGMQVKISPSIGSILRRFRVASCTPKEATVRFPQKLVEAAANDIAVMAANNMADTPPEDLIQNAWEAYGGQAIEEILFDMEGVGQKDKAGLFKAVSEYLRKKGDYVGFKKWRASGWTSEDRPYREKPSGIPGFVVPGNPV